MANDNALAPPPVGSKEGHHLQLTTAGVVMPAQLGDMIEFAKIMSKADVAIPKHLRGNPGACLAVAMRSRAWAMDPFAVATKTYSVNDILAYESQLINAVINRHAPIKGRLVPTYKGEGQERQCNLEPETTDGQKLPYTSPKVKDIKVKNSPLWSSDPDQQLYYTSSRAWARRYFPELLMGVYDPDEARSMKDITPAQPVDNFLHDEEAHEQHQITKETVVGHIDTVIDGQAERIPVVADAPANLFPAEAAADRPGIESLITEEMIVENMLKSVAYCQTTKDLDEVSRLNAADILTLSKDAQKVIRKAISDRSIEVEP